MDPANQQSLGLLQSLPSEIFSLLQEAERVAEAEIKDCLASPTPEELLAYLNTGPVMIVRTSNGNDFWVKQRWSVLTSHYNRQSRIVVQVARLQSDGYAYQEGRALLYPNGACTQNPNKILLPDEYPYQLQGINSSNFYMKVSKVDLLTEYHILSTQRICPIVDYPKRHLADRYNTEFALKLHDPLTHDDSRRFLTAYFISAMLSGREDLLREKITINTDQRGIHNSLSEMFENCALHIRDEVIRLTGARPSLENELTLVI